MNSKTPAVDALKLSEYICETTSTSQVSDRARSGTREPVVRRSPHRKASTSTQHSIGAAGHKGTSTKDFIGQEPMTSPVDPVFVESVLRSPVRQRAPSNAKDRLGIRYAMGAATSGAQSANKDSTEFSHHKADQRFSVSGSQYFPSVVTELTGGPAIHDNSMDT